MTRNFVQTIEYAIIPFIVCFSLCLPFNCCAQDATLAEQTKGWEHFVDEGGMPGAVLVLATPKEIVSVHTYGWADIATKKPMMENAFFWIASNTKAIVAASVMICVDEGLIKLDDPLEKYLPQLSDLRVERSLSEGRTELTVASSKPTIRQALSHTAGFRFITRYQERYGIDSLPVQRLMTTVGMTPLIDNPGARYSYSNIGIDAAQAVIEVVTGRSFEEFVQERVFDPLEMNDTTFFPSDEQLGRLATVYSYDQKENVLVPIRFAQMPSLDDGSPRYAEGGGGLFSSAIDLVKFYQMLGGKGVGANGARILSEEAVEEMTRKQTGNAISEEYAFGLRENDAWFGHGGAYGTQGIAYRDGSVVGVYMVAVAGLPKQGEAENAFREIVKTFSGRAK